MTLLRIALCLLAVFGCAVAEMYCPTAPSDPQDRRTNTSLFRFVHFNAEWLYIDGYDDCPGSGCPWEDDEAAHHHLHSIADVLAELDADLINLAEVESCDELHDLLQTDALRNGHYSPYMVQGKDTSTGQDVGMLTRVDPQQDLFRTENRVEYPLPSTQCTSTYTGTYGVSKHYITTLDVNDIPLAVISCHLLAFPDDENRCVQREAQVSVMAEVVGEYVSRGYEVIFTGDFNDFDSAVVDANNNLPISQVMDIATGGHSHAHAKGHSHAASFSSSSKAAAEGVGAGAGADTGWTLHNVASLMPQSDRYTIWWDSNSDCVYGQNETSMIDHVLVTPGLLQRVSGVFFDHTAFTPSCESFYSDHWPLVVDFVF